MLGNNFSSKIENSIKCKMIQVYSSCFIIHAFILFVDQLAAAKTTVCSDTLAFACAGPYEVEYSICQSCRQSWEYLHYMLNNLDYLNDESENFFLLENQMNWYC